MEDFLILLCGILLKQRRRRDEQSCETSDDDNSSNSKQVIQQKTSAQRGQTNALSRPKRCIKTRKALVSKYSEISRGALKRSRATTKILQKTQFAKKIKTAAPSSTDSEYDFGNDEAGDGMTKQMPEIECNSTPYPVAISHKKYPEVKLNEEEIMKIKISLLTEIDEIEDRVASIGFVSSATEDGWLSLTCQNKETRDWLMSVISKLNASLNIDIKASMEIPISNTFICALHITASDIMPPETLKHRLAKQNLGLLTTEWRILNSLKNETGGETVTYCIDEKSKEYIEARGCKLFLNFSQTAVDIN